MKFYRSIRISEKKCPPGLFATIVKLKPECGKSGYQGENVFHLEAQPDDETGGQLVEEIVGLCRRYGMRDTSEAGGQWVYSHLALVHYELSDLNSAALLQLMTQKRVFKGINSGDRDEMGRVWLPASEAKPTIKILSIFLRPWIVVSDETRQILEKGELVGLKFDPVTIKGHSVYASPNPFWELRSTITLPKMLNAMRNPAVTCESYLAKDRYGEIRYRQSDLRSLGDFDIAFTLEPFGGAVPNPVLIVSQRFYQHCMKHKIPLEVRPVRIDPD